MLYICRICIIFYLKRIKRDWLTKAMEESTRRVADAYSPGYDPHSLNKKLGPWGSGTKPTMTLDEMLEELEEKRWTTSSGIYGDSTMTPTIILMKRKSQRTIGTMTQLGTEIGWEEDMIKNG